MWDQAQAILNESVARTVAAVAQFLPAALAFILILVLALALAWAVRAVLRRSLPRLNFDAAVARWGLGELAEWSPSGSPTLLVAAIAFWTIVLLGLLTGLSALSTTWASQVTVDLLTLLQQVLISLFILAVGVAIARFLARSVLITAVNMQIQSARLLSLGVKWLVLVFAATLALEHLNIGGGIVPLAFGILFGGIVLALALAVGLGSKEIVARSWERQTSKSEEPAPEQVHQL